MPYLVCDEIGTPYFINLVEKAEIFRTELSSLVIEPNRILNLSTFYYYQGKTKDSFFFIDKGISMYKKNDNFKIEKCKILILQKKYEEAIDILDSLKEPYSPNALYERTKLAMLMHREKEAKEYVDSLLTKAPNQTEVYARLTFFFAVNHMLKEAKECWEAGCKNPLHSINFELARVALEYETGNYEKAYKYCFNLRRRRPNHLVIELYLASLCISLKKYKKAENILFRLQKFYPMNKELAKMSLILSNIHKDKKKKSTSVQ